MTPGGAVKLANFAEGGDPNVHVACAKCGRWDSYNIERLLRAYVELLPISFLESVTLDCERRIAADPSDPCAAIYAGCNHLPPLGR